MGPCSANSLCRCSRSRCTAHGALYALAIVRDHRDAVTGPGTGAVATITGVPQAAAGLPQVYIAEQPQQAEDDQLGRDDIVQQPGHDQNQYACDQRYEGPQSQVDIHDILVCVQKALLALLYQAKRRNPTSPTLSSSRARIAMPCCPSVGMPSKNTVLVIRQLSPP